MASVREAASAVAVVRANRGEDLGGQVDLSAPRWCQPVLRAVFSETGHPEQVPFNVREGVNGTHQLPRQVT